MGLRRHNGFLAGLGLIPADPTAREPVIHAAVVCSAFTRGQTALAEEALQACLRNHPEINLVFTVTEPIAAGAAQALAATGRTATLPLLSFDGSCQGLADVAAGRLSADVAPDLNRFAELSVDLTVDFLRTGRRAQGRYDPGATLVTQRPLPGLPSQTAEQRGSQCWGALKRP
jgi:fructose transport system substrate-binding protein